MKRTKPYTVNGITRVSCAVCGKPSIAQWKVRSCALGGPEVYKGLCKACDVHLNEWVLLFFNVAHNKEIIKKYVEQK